MVTPATHRKTQLLLFLPTYGDVGRPIANLERRELAKMEQGRYMQFYEKGIGSGLDDKGMRGVLAVFAPGSCHFRMKKVAYATLIVPPKPTKISKKEKEKEVSRGQESSIDAMLPMMTQSRVETPR
jgi:hypothetical protein